jgi:diguanylate cyclase (GGDEF)-like protein
MKIYNPNQSGAISILTSLGLKSLSQRYLVAMLIVSMLLCTFAYFAWQYVRSSNQAQFNQIQDRAEATDAIKSVSDQVHVIEVNMLRYITLPSQEHEARIHRAYKLYDSEIAKLLANNWIKSDKSLQDLLVAMEADRKQLNTATNNLLAVRQDETRWFPAMRIMQEQMLQQNRKFTTTLSFMINNISDELNNPARRETYKLLIEIRHNWELMTSEFRLYISNGFGIFSNNPRLAMQTRRSNTNMYISNLDGLLNRLQRRGRAGLLDGLSKTAITELQEHFKNWTKAYKNVVDTYAKREWRQDLLILHKDIEPLLDRILRRASSLQLELGVASAKDITRLTGVAQSLSNSVVYITIGLSLIGFLGYFMFHRVILLPIATVTRALKNEVLTPHLDQSQLHLSDAREILDLTNAFYEMREQIRSREAHLDHMAHHDSLTALPNRILLRDRLSQAMARAKRDHKMVGLMFLDLDRFKQINDSLGHHVGDRLLQLVATRLSNCIRATDTVARLGGDEFGIVVENVGQADQIASLAEKILNSFTKSLQVESHELHTSTSIGIALGPNDDNDVDSLIKDADIAMYHAKDQGRNNYKFYSAEMAAQVARHMRLETQLHQAMENNEFVLHYQPIVSLETGQIISTEALLRWQHREQAMLAPTEFLPVLQDSGMMRPLTQWVLQQASAQYLRHNQAGFPQIRMAINLPGLMLHNDAFLELVIATIEQTRIDPTGLLVEFTEDTLLESLMDSKKALVALRDMGVRIALDDFGTGQSSLSHLRQNPIDIVKIDRDFIHDIPTDKYDCELVDAIIAMAHKLHIKVVAEGVETQQQLDFLHRHKCDAIQGYYYSSALDGDKILELIRQNQPMPLVSASH